MKKLLPVLLATIAVPVILFADKPPAKHIKIKKQGATKTAVLYSHTQHDAKIGDKAKDCNTCHNAVKTKDSAHKYCTECHKTMKSGPGLAKCNDCHKPAK